MNIKQKRLIEVYEYTRKHFGVHTQGDFADAIKAARGSVNLALNGKESYLSDKLFQRICDAYPGVFNLDYLLHGTGNLVSIEEEVRAEDTLDQSSQVNAIIAGRDMTIAAQKDVIESQKQTIETLKSELNTKKEMIEMMKSTIADLRRQLAEKSDQDILAAYPFKTGVADDFRKTHP